MSVINLLGTLLPTIPQIHELIQTIREKYNLPPLLPEDVQLVETLREERTTEEWKAIRDDIEIEFRAKCQILSPELGALAQNFMNIIYASEALKDTENSTVDISEIEKSKLKAVVKDAQSALEFINQFYKKGADLIFDHLITGRPIVPPSQLFNIVINASIPPTGEKVVIAVAHQLSDPDEITKIFRAKIIETFDEKPKVREDDLEIAEYLAGKNTGKKIGDIVALYLERHPDEIPYKKGTKNYNNAVKKLKDSMRQKLYRLQQDVNQIVGRDKN